MAERILEAAADTSGGRQALAQRIWRSQLECGPSEMQRLPGERELSLTHGVTRDAVRKAVFLLEKEGLVCRMPRSGTFVRRAKVAPGPSAGAACKCINFLQDPDITLEPLQWLSRDYLAGYTEALERSHVKTRFVCCPRDLSDCESLFWPELPLREQACILLNRRSPKLLHWLRRRGIPFVLQGPYHYETAGLPEHHKVYVNKAGGAFLGTRHLLELGHRRIGFIGHLPGHGGGFPVYEGFSAAMRCSGVSIEPGATLLSAFDSVPDDLAPIVEFLRRPDRPTAVLARNDMMAISVLLAARMLGLRVPQDLSVVGVNNQAEAARVAPPLTTVAVPRRQLAAATAEMLLSVVREPPATFQTRILECELVVRRSTCPPPQKECRAGPETARIQKAARGARDSRERRAAVRTVS